MGIMDATETIIVGLVSLIIIGAVITALYPTLQTYFGNAEIFATGALVLALIGLIALVFIIGLFKRIMDDTKETRQKVSDTASIFRRE